MCLSRQNSNLIFFEELQFLNGLALDLLGRGQVTAPIEIFEPTLELLVFVGELLHRHEVHWNFGLFSRHYGLPHPLLLIKYTARHVHVNCS
jgi:hypothetical protein